MTWFTRMSQVYGILKFPARMLKDKTGSVVRAVAVIEGFRDTERTGE